MRISNFRAIALVAVAFSASFAAEVTVEQRARISGNSAGSEGECTVKVDVDGVADIEVRGDRARLRTLSGQPSRWVLFECNQTLPLNPSEFRFRGVDGRGRVNLVREPGNSGMAVVRIEDTKGGREEYHFKLQWRGGTGAVGGNWGNQSGDIRGNSGNNGWGSGTGGGRWSGNRGNSGWGNRGNVQVNNEINFSGRGTGTVSRSGQTRRINDVSVNVDRNGMLRSSFDAQGWGRGDFTGRVIQSNRNGYTAEVVGGDNSSVRGTMYITTDNRNQVTRIRMDGSTRSNEDLQLDWRR